MHRLVLLFVLSPMPVLAHPGDHGVMGLLHFLVAPDHLAILALVITVVAFAFAKMRARR